MDKKRIGLLSFGLVIALVMALLLPNFKVGNKISAAAQQVAYIASGEKFSQLVENEVISTIPSNGTFSVEYHGEYVVSAYNPGLSAVVPADVSYNLVLAGDSAGSVTKNFPQNTFIRLIDFSDDADSSKVYSRTVDNLTTSSINLNLFSYGVERFRENASLTVGETFNEEFQFIIDLSQTSFTISNNYYLILTRTVTTYSGSTTTQISNVSLTFEDVTTTFALAASKVGTYFYTNSANVFNLTITPSTTGLSSDTAFAQYGRGVKVELVGGTLPALTSVVATYNGRTYGNSISTSKSIDFSTTQASQIAFEINIPSGVLADGNYTLRFSVFDEFDSISASANVNITVVNTNFDFNIKTYADNGSGYTPSLVYFTKQTEDFAFELVEDLPNDSYVIFSIERRTVSGAWISFASISAQLSTIEKANFDEDLTEINSNIYSIVCPLTFTGSDEGVYRFKLEVYDSNGDLMATNYAFFVVANN